MNDWKVLEEHPSLVVTGCEGAARLELRRPESLNAFDDRLARDFLDALRRLGAEDAIRCIVVTGSGRAFSAGADIKTQFAGGASRDLGEVLREVTHPTICALREMPKPVVAAVNGPAAGVACSIALACDLVIAAESASFLLPFAALGLSLDGGATLTVPARVGLARTFRMALLGERVSARDACSWGLIDQVVADDELAESAEALALRLASGPTLAFAAIKRAVSAGTLGSLRDQLELEATLQSELGRSDDFLEGVAAFMEKRSPNFKGIRNSSGADA
jgi:enoyl-CoA hydratase/carnithine racemase